MIAIAIKVVIGSIISCQFFNQGKVKPKAIDFSRVLSKLQVIVRNSDWFIALFAPVLIGSSYYFVIGFSTVI